MNRRGLTKHGERGFTLTELIVALVLASGIFVGMAELSRQMVRSIGQIRSDIDQTQSLRRLSFINELVERSNSDTDQTRFPLGETLVVEQHAQEDGFEVRYRRDGQLLAQWRIPSAMRGHSSSWRTVEYDCSYDLIADRCRS